MVDSDGDKYFTSSKSLTGCDCDDSNPNTYPGAPEICNHKDDNCNGKIDEGCDDDKDGYVDKDFTCPDSPGLFKNGNGATSSCSGHKNDCNDTVASIYPREGNELNPQECDTQDNNCDGKLNDGIEGICAAGCKGDFIMNVGCCYIEADTDDWNLGVSKEDGDGTNDLYMCVRSKQPPGLTYTDSQQPVWARAISSNAGLVYDIVFPLGSSSQYYTNYQVLIAPDYSPTLKFATCSIPNKYYLLYENGNAINLVAGEIISVNKYGVMHGYICKTDKKLIECGLKGAASGINTIPETKSQFVASGETYTINYEPIRVTYQDPKINGVSILYTPKSTSPTCVTRSSFSVGQFCAERGGTMVSADSRSTSAKNMYYDGTKDQWLLESAASPGCGGYAGNIECDLFNDNPASKEFLCHDGTWLDPSKLKDADTEELCIIIDGTWTGTKCCLEGKYYNDSDPVSKESQGCWNGIVMHNNEFVTEDAVDYQDKIIYSDGFYSCGSLVGISVPKNAPVSAAASCKPTSTTTYYCSNNKVFDHDTPLPSWTSYMAHIKTGDTDIKDMREHSIPAGCETEYLYTSCCPKHTCWNGYACVGPDINQLVTVNSEGEMKLTTDITVNSPPDVLKENILTNSTGGEFVCAEKVRRNVGTTYGADWIPLSDLNIEYSEELCNNYYPPGNVEDILGIDRGWTGSRCCYKDAQYYNEKVGSRWKAGTDGTSVRETDARTGLTDEQIVGGCWGGKIVKKESFPTGNFQYANLDGEFFACREFDDTIQSKFNISDRPTAKPACEIEVIDGDPYYCSFTRPIWDVDLNHIDPSPESETVSNVNKQKPLPGSNVNAQCCPSTSCWNGDKCVGAHSSQENLFASVEGKDYICSNMGNWNEIQFKYDWNNDLRGICAEKTQCYLKPYDAAVDQISAASPNPLLYTSSIPPACIRGDDYRQYMRYVGDHYCDNGNWTTRTKLIALKLADYAKTKYANKPYVLQCGNITNMLNLMDYPLGTVPYLAQDNEVIEMPVNAIEFLEKPPERSYDAPLRAEDFDSSNHALYAIEDCFGDRCVNNACVLKIIDGGTEKVLLGISLNQEISNENQMINFINVFSQYGKVSFDACLGKTGNSYQRCSENLYYNPDMKTAIFSKDSITNLEPSTFSAFWQSPIDTIKTLLLGAVANTKKSDVKVALERSGSFDTVFFSESGAKKASGFVEAKKIGSEAGAGMKLFMTMNFTGFTNAAGQPADFCPTIINYGRSEGITISCNNNIVLVEVLDNAIGRSRITILWNELTRMKFT